MKQRFDVYGMTCASCQAAVDRAVKKLGVDDVNVNLINETMSVNYDPNKISDEDIINAVSKAGYEARVKNMKKTKQRQVIILKKLRKKTLNSGLKSHFSLWLFLCMLLWVLW